jgi:hypothetical protein
MLRKTFFLYLPSDDLIERNGLMNVAAEDLLLQELSRRNVERLNRSEKLKKTKIIFKIGVDTYYERY